MQTSGLSLLFRAITALTAAFSISVASPAVGATEYDRLIGEGDQIYARRESTIHARAAVDIYLRAAELNPDRPEAYWRAARAWYWTASGIKSREQRLAYCERGLECARKSVAVAPDDPASHYWLGVCLGVYGNAKGALESLNLVEEIKQEMAAVIRLDPAYDEGGAYLILGRLWYKLPGIFGGSNEKALENLNKSLEYGPDRQLTHYYLAQVYLDEEKPDLARAHLQKALDIPCRADYAPECRIWKKRAQRLMDILNDKK